MKSFLNYTILFCCYTQLFNTTSATGACPNTLDNYILEGYRQKLENAFEEVEAYLDMSPIDDSEVSDDLFGETIVEALVQLNLYLAITQDLQQDGHFETPQELVTQSRDLQLMFQLTKDAVKLYKMLHYCFINQGTPLSRKTIKEWMPPELMTMEILRFQEEHLHSVDCDCDWELAIPIDSISMYYDVPNVTCSLVDDAVVKINIRIPLKSKLSDWDIYHVSYEDDDEQSQIMVLAHDKLSQRVLLLNEEESAECIRTELCKLPLSRESAVLPDEQRLCVLDAIENGVESLPPDCLQLPGQASISVSDDSNDYVVVFDKHIQD